MPNYTVAALQIGTSPEGTAATIDKILSYEDEIIAKGVKLVVVPEATVGGYPKGSTFGAYIGYRTQSGREEYLKYHSQAIAIPNGPECDALAKFSARTGAMLVVGTIERDGGTLYCTLAYFDPALGYVCKHRKTMPTASERLVWGQGDGSGLVVAQHAELGPVGGAICWENYMPLLRASFYAKGVKVYVAPTVDERDVWQALMRTIAVEGRCFVVSAVQFLPPIPNMPEWEEGRNAINGGSVIVGPLGDVIAGPFSGQEGLLTAEIELDKIVEAQFDLDLNGHYSRKDIFTLTVDETPRDGVSFEKN